VLTLGLNVKTHNNKRVVCGVILDAANDSLVATIEHVPNLRDGEAKKAYEAHKTLATALKGKDIDAAVLLEADYNTRQALSAGVKERLRLEGVCLAASRERIAVVEIVNGPELGRACGTDKAGALRAAEKLGVESVLVEAAAAALAAKSKRT
jgi:hypothetical protein